jgi:hypothetical protein
MASLLAVDLGVRTGLALYGGDGKLVWYRSQNFGSIERLRRGTAAILHSIPDLAVVVMEGGGTIANVWEKEAERRGVAVRRLHADVWRPLFLIPRDRRTGVDAKKSAGEAARRVIEWSGAKRPVSLRHDAAEAIMVGLWGVLEFGWLEDVPQEVLVG